VTVSLSRLTPQPLSLRDAALAILAAVATNTSVKIGIGGVIGRGRFAVEIALMTIGCLLAGAAALWATLALMAQ
jgi:uncharacterized membrane protein (DUF4010 family)